MKGPASAAPVVVGAGPGGLSVARALMRHGVQPRILDRADRVCSSWQTHYDSLRMNSPRRLSSLPGQLMDRSFGGWVRRDDFIGYVERYAEPVRSRLEFGVEVRRVERDGDGWLVDSSEGPLRSSHVIVATGLNATNHMPAWPGRDGFEGSLLHAMEYRRPEPYRGRHVLVVGLGPTGVDVVTDVAAAGAASVRLSVRHTPIIIHRSAAMATLGVVMKHVINPSWFVDFASLQLHRMLWGDLSRYGIAPPESGLATAIRNRTHGLTADGGAIDAIRKGAVEVVPAVEGFDGPDVLLAGGDRIRPDVVIAATGQRPNLEPLVGHLGVLGPDGRPLVHGAETAPSAPGLHFIGYRVPPPQLADMRFDAPAIARAVSSSIAANGSAPPS